MRRTILALALTAVFFAEAVPLLKLPDAPHCSCVVKSACCRLEVCPMEAKRHHRGATPSFASCPGSPNAQVLPPFLGRTAVVRQNLLTFARVAEGERLATNTPRAIERSVVVEEQPPRGFVLATL